jgi:Ser/Thr protein kinase RdoA (MazF antagonist)
MPDNESDDSIRSRMNHPSPLDTDAEHRVHGLADDRIAPDWPPLIDAEIGAVLDQFPDAGRPRAIDWHSPRPLSAAARVDTDRGGVFVKRHHRSVRSVATLTEEHRFAAHLQAAGQPVPEILTDTSGATAVAIDEWVYEVHALAAGEDVYCDVVSWEPASHLGHAQAAGAALAQLHRAAAGFDAPQRDTHILVTRCDLIAATDPVATLSAQLPQRPGLADYLKQRNWQNDLREVLGPRHATMQPRLIAQPRLWTHNDWHVSNLFWKDDAVSAVLDFGLASPTSAVFDLATAIERNAIAWLQLEHTEDIGHADIARALIAGYRSRGPLDADAVHLVADLLPLVHVDFALSEVEYFHAITGHDEHADVAYHTFLHGHAAWFDSAHGRAFVEALHDVA